MVRSISILFLLLFSSVAVFADIQEVQIMGRKVTVCKSTASNATTFAIVSSPDIGQLKGSHNSTLNSVDVYRSTYEFDYSTYSPALDVKSVSINISPSGNPIGCTFSITSPSSAIAANASSFDNVSSAGSLFSSLNYSGSNMPTSGSDLTEAVKNAIKNQGKLYLGAYSDNESQDSTQLLVNISITVHYEQKYFVSAKAMTNFGGGYILVSGERKNHGQEFSRIEGEDVTLEAVDQDYGGYKRVWKSGINESKWEEKLRNQDPVGISTDRSFNLNMTMSRNGAEYKANYRKVFNVGFSVKSSNPSLQVPITLNGNNYINSIPPLEVIYGDQLSITVPTTIELNNIIYRVNGAGSGNTTTFSFNPSDHANFQIEYTGYADKAFNLHLLNTGSAISVGVGLAWNEYPNSNVTQYQIYRSTVQQNGGGGDAGVIATVSRGTTSYCDMTATYDPQGNYNLYYEVLPYYAPDNTFANVHIHNCVATVGLPYGYLDKKAGTADIVTEYSLSSFPNPFNPTTTISYSLKHNDFVTIKVFDILGNLVSDLVKENMPAGQHSVVFNASGYPSGFYLVKIQAGEYTNTRKILLMK